MNRRLAWLVGSGALVAWGFAGALGGCGSSDANIADSTADGGEAGNGTSGGTSGATSGGTSGGTSGDPGTDGGGGTDGSSGGTDGGNKDGGGGGVEAGASTPDKVPCANGMSCTTPTQVCCITGTGDGGCQPAADTCSGAKIRCDEKADCTGTEICCGGAFGGGGGGTECKTGACSGNQVQLCKTNAECTGGTCYVNTCPTLMGGTITVESCTKLPMPCTQ